MNKVSRYDANGWVEDIGDLIYGRNVHGCMTSPVVNEVVTRRLLGNIVLKMLVDECCVWRWKQQWSSEPL